jgi:Mn2+/Fe2+ NRAMP family transporter
MQTRKNIRDFFRILGPGLMYAGAAVGVSHLVQSTRAGAAYGFDLLLIVVVVNVIKYPFFEAAPRYVLGTGKNLIAGYHSLGKYAVIILAVLTLITMFPILAAVSIVTSGIFSHAFSIGMDINHLNTLLLLVLMLFVLLGQYKTLDKIIKWIIIALAVSTILAVAFSARRGFETGSFTNHFDWFNRLDILFLIALIGWMPAPIDVSVWSSMWSEAKLKNMGSKLSMRGALIDFKIGYWGTTFLAAAFVLLGAFVMQGSGETLAADGTGFARQLISMYTGSLGSWAWPVIVIAALSTMLSTTITVLDAYPRILRPITEILIPRFKDEKEGQNKIYRFWMFAMVAGTIILVNYLSQPMRFMVDLATTLSFVTAPVFAILNYKVLTHDTLPLHARPVKWMRIFSIFGIVFLSLFSIVFIIWRFFI